MSSLLDFQNQLIHRGQSAIYSIETGELNPEVETEVVKGTEKTFKRGKYDLKRIREYIYEHSSTLAESGNIISGEVTEHDLVLTVLKIK